MPYLYSVDPDQLASEANWSGSTLFALRMWTYINNLNQVIWFVERGSGRGMLIYDQHNMGLDRRGKELKCLNMKGKYGR